MVGVFMRVVSLEAAIKTFLYHYFRSVNGVVALKISCSS
jgi:hypothetical protein